MKNINDENNNLKFEKKQFRKLKKVELVEIIFEYQNLVLNLKAKIVELERMLEERGDVIKSLENELKRSSTIDELVRVAKGAEDVIGEIKRYTPFCGFLA